MGIKQTRHQVIAALQAAILAHLIRSEVGISHFDRIISIDISEEFDGNATDTTLSCAHGYLDCQKEFIEK